MSLRIVVAVVLGSFAGGAMTYVLTRPRTEPQSTPSRSGVTVGESDDPSLPPAITKRDSIDSNDRGLRYPPIHVRLDQTLDVTNEQYDCLNWPGDLKPDRRAVLARLSKDRHELEIRIGYTLATIHCAAILTLRDDQTANAAVQLDSDRGQIDEDSARGLTGDISVNSLNWNDPRICGTFELHWTKDGSGRCQHGTFSIVQSEIQR